MACTSGWTGNWLSGDMPANETPAGKTPVGELSADGPVVVDALGAVVGDAVFAIGSRLGEVTTVPRGPTAPAADDAAAAKL